MLHMVSRVTDVYPAVMSCDTDVLSHRCLSDLVASVADVSVYPAVFSVVTDIVMYYRCLSCVTDLSHVRDICF